MLFTAEQRAALSAHERLWQWKLGLRSILLLFAIISVALLGYVIGSVRGNSYEYVEIYAGVFSLACLGWCIIWAFINIPYLLIRKKTVHPGWNVGADLIGFIALSIAAGSAITYGVLAVADPSVFWEGGGSSSYCSYSYDSSSYGCDYSSRDTPNYSKQKSVAVGQLVGGIFAMIVALLEFTLFVWACVDTHRHNYRVRDAQVAVMTSRVIDNMRQSGQFPAAEYPPIQQQQQNLPLLYQPEPAMVPQGRDVEHGETMYGAGMPPQVPPPPSNHVPMASRGIHPVYRAP